MRITIESSVSVGYQVIVESPTDDPDVGTMVRMMCQAMFGFGTGGGAAAFAVRLHQEAERLRHEWGVPERAFHRTGDVLESART